MVEAVSAAVFLQLESPQLQTENLLHSTKTPRSVETQSTVKTIDLTLSLNNLF